MTQTVPDISPLMPMHQDPLLVSPFSLDHRGDGIILKHPPLFCGKTVPWQGRLSICLIHNIHITDRRYVKKHTPGKIDGYNCRIHSDNCGQNMHIHDDVIKWNHFPRYWPFVRGNHRPPVNSPHKGQWRGALMFSLICAWIDGCVNNRDAGDLRRQCAHYDVIVMSSRLYHNAHQLIGYSE